MATMQRRQFQKGETIIREGERGNLAWLIEEGQIEVFRAAADGTETRLSVLEKGAMIGEMALIDDGIRMASARALSAVSCLEINRNTLKQLIAKSQPLAAYLLESMVAAIRRSHGMPQEERSLGGSDIRSVRNGDKVINRRVFDSGFAFFKQGDAPTVAFLIQSGEVAIERDGPNGFEELGHLGPGRIFGELAMLSNEPRKATAVAKSQVICEVITKQAFTETLATMPPILRALTKIYIKQLNKFSAH